MRLEIAPGCCVVLPCIGTWIWETFIRINTRVNRIQLNTVDLAEHECGSRSLIFNPGLFFVGFLAQACSSRMNTHGIITYEHGLCLFTPSHCLAKQALELPRSKTRSAGRMVYIVELARLTVWYGEQGFPRNQGYRRPQVLNTNSVEGTA
jgi:hypothetical protein